MYARKRVVAVDAPIDTLLRKKLTGIYHLENQRVAVEKDLHLIEAARATEETVASRDSTVRQLLCNAATRVTELKTIVWVNPDEPAEEPIAWLKAGAKRERKRMLGSPHE